MRGIQRAWMPHIAAALLGASLDWIFVWDRRTWLFLNRTWKVSPAMLKAKVAKDPVVLSYVALRRAVGLVALLLPFALALPWWILHGHAVQPSISDYYYTGMRNLLVGSLCAISMFMLGCRGYDWQDEVAGILSAIFALGVASFPTTPDCADPHEQAVGVAHYTFATLLFLTLAYFCLVLFRMSAVGVVVTRKKGQRNLVYMVCGVVILVSIGMIGLRKLLGWEYCILGLNPTLVFETTSLLAFGAAWLIKGETFLKDRALSESSSSIDLTPYVLEE